jgi:hypothetical protein
MVEIVHLMARQAAFFVDIHVQALAVTFRVKPDLWCYMEIAGFAELQGAFQFRYFAVFGGQCLPMGCSQAA